MTTKIALASEGRWKCQINELLPRETRSLPKALKDFALVWWPFTQGGASEGATKWDPLSHIVPIGPDQRRAGGMRRRMVRFRRAADA